MSLEYPVVLECKKLLKTNDGAMSKGYSSQPEGGLPTARFRETRASNESQDSDGL